MRNRGPEMPGITNAKDLTKDPNEPKIIFIHRLWLLFGFEWFWIMLGAFFGILNGCTPIMFYFVLGGLLDILVPKRGFAPITPEQIGDSIQRQVIYLVLVAISSGLSNGMSQFCNSITSQRVGTKLKQQYFKKLLRQEVGFYDLRQTGFFLNNMTEDVALIQQAYGERLTLFFQYVSQALLGIILAFTTSWRMSLMISIAAPVIMILLGGSGPIVGIFTKKTQQAGSDANTVAAEIVQAMRTVRSMSGELKEIKRYRASLGAVNFVGIFRSFGVALATGLAFGAIWGCAALSFFYGGHLINWGLLTVGSLFQIFGNMLFAVIGLGLALSQVPPMLKAIEISKLILKVINRTPAIRPIGGKKIPGGLKGDIEIKNINFTYPTRQEQQILFDFSLSIKAGQTAALVGKSGSGKSTIMGLLERFYEAQSGEIFLDGHNIKDLDPVWLHKEIGIVTQEPTLFAATISENIIYGVDPSTVTGEQIIAAAKAANCHNFIVNELSHGYNTMVGERGASLSGGQKQRVAIARAMLQNPKILLLDEATSALDTESEHLVQEALERLMVGKTSIVIAHRLSTIKNSNVIFVVDKGRVVEQGTHEELLKVPGGSYALLANRQMQFGQVKEHKFVAFDFQSTTSLKDQILGFAKAIKENSMIEVDEQLTLKNIIKETYNLLKENEDMPESEAQEKCRILEDKINEIVLKKQPHQSIQSTEPELISGDVELNDIPMNNESIELKPTEIMDSETLVNHMNEQNEASKRSEGMTEETKDSTEVEQDKEIPNNEESKTMEDAIEQDENTKNEEPMEVVAHDEDSPKHEDEQPSTPLVSQQPGDDSFKVEEHSE